jgi:phosphotriesterase-related protein
MRIETVRGPIAPDQLGVTLTHEHTLIDAYAWRHGSESRTVPWGYSVDGIVDDEALLAEELGYYRDAGGQALVDVTNVGIGRNPEGLRRLAEATGLHIVMGAGWYREAVYPPAIFSSSTNQLADLLIREISDGADGTGIRPGVIGELGTEKNAISPAQERVFRAAARAARATGIAISTHTTALGTMAEEQVDLLVEEGVAPERIIVGHLGSRRRDALDLIALAARGVFVQVDHVGSPPERGVQPDHQKAANVVGVVRAGHLERVLLSMDHDGKSQLHWFGGYGYDYLLREFVPLLRAQGLEEAELHAILIDNPRRALAF